jgi:hypothetical protein
MIGEIVDGWGGEAGREGGDVAGGEGKRARESKAMPGGGLRGGIRYAETVQESVR